MTRTPPGRPGDAVAPDDPVHQVVFRWAGNVGHRGAGIAAVAHSCPEPEARELADRLGPVLRVMGDVQRPSLVRHIIPGDRVLLVRRTPGSDAQKRDSTVCHALLGPARILLPLYCVSLGAVAWAEEGWADRVTGPIEPMPRDRLKALANHMRHRMWENVRLVRRPLICLVAQFLRTPGARLSALVGELDDSLATARAAQAPGHRPVPPGRESPEPALLVLWGLWWIFGSSLDRGSGSWQFATFDTMDDQAYRVVFVPAWRVSPAEDSRLRRIDLLDPGTDPAAELAATLVDHYLDWSLGKYQRLLDTDPNAADPEVRRFHTRLREVWPARYESPVTTDTGSVPVISQPLPLEVEKQPALPQQPHAQEELPTHQPTRDTPASDSILTPPPEWRQQQLESTELPSPSPSRHPTTEPQQTGSPTEEAQDPLEGTEAQRAIAEPLPPESMPATAHATNPSGQARDPRQPEQHGQSERSGQRAHQSYPEPPSTPPQYTPQYVPQYGPPPPPPSGFPARTDAPLATHHPTPPVTSAATSSATAPAMGAITDRLTPDRRRTLNDDALPDLFDQPVAGRSPRSKLWAHRGRRARMEWSQILMLADDLTHATNRAEPAADLLHKTEERLAQAHHKDLLSVLRQPLHYAAQNIVLEYLPPAVQADESARDLLATLLTADFRITASPDPLDLYLTDLHAQRTARMIRWFFGWLVEPRTTKHHGPGLTKYLSSIASSDDPADHQILQELLIDAKEDRIPPLPKETWLAVTRALYEKAHP
ncbi:hypothetical protein ABT127_23395 [Streptomyces sp. NPDC001904]|uniref:hypothetical protein n=1 Tax=Streptomyces sp. NPDC001904 TaxID=3154531 RepID=UPI0033269948